MNMDVSSCYQACQPQQKCSHDKCDRLCLRRSLWYLRINNKRVTCWVALCEAHEPRLEDIYSSELDTDELDTEA